MHNIVQHCYCRNIERKSLTSTGLSTVAFVVADVSAVVAVDVTTLVVVVEVGVGTVGLAGVGSTVVTVLLLSGASLVLTIQAVLVMLHIFASLELFARSELKNHQCHDAQCEHLRHDKKKDRMCISLSSISMEHAFAF